mmetsp:Transcript_41300/g.80837  ORF Transcript_41300/g.80837 Transcript_41300/m.80837 type:complete len:221 (-) Transcript_41300:938-1600(-)
MEYPSTRRRRDFPLICHTGFCQLALQMLDPLKRLLKLRLYLRDPAHLELRFCRSVRTVSGVRRIEAHGDRIQAASPNPLVRSMRRYRRRTVRKQVFLKSVTLPRNDERERRHAIPRYLEQTGRLVVSHVNGAFRHHAHALAGNCGLEHSDTVEGLLFGRVFVVANVSVSLAAEVEDTGVNVVEGHDNARCLVDGFRVNGGRSVTQIPHLELTARALGESH